MMGNYERTFAERFSYEEVKNSIYPFIRNLYSANTESLDYTKELAEKCPALSTNGVFVFFVAAMDHFFPVHNMAEEITFDMVNLWNVPTDVLYRQAMANLDKLPIRMSSAYDNLVFQVDTSSELFPNFECSWFLSRKKRKEIREKLGDDFYIFPASIWKSYIIRKEDANAICNGEADASFLLTYVFSKLGFPTDNLLRHGYLYEDGELQIKEYTASKKDTKVVGFHPSSN